MTTLEERVSAFLRSLPGAESIDRILPISMHEGHRRADYLLDQRRVIVELKTLKIDPSRKVHSEIDKHRERKDFPIFFGTSTTEKVLARLPDGAQIKRRILGAITRSVEDAVRSAEAQIDDTRRILSLPKSVGLLVLLNESIAVLDPEVAGHRVAALMGRHRTGRSSSTLPLTFAWLIFESHVVAVPEHPHAFVSLLINGPDAEAFPWFDAVFERVQCAWAAHNNACLIVSTDKPTS